MEQELFLCACGYKLKCGGFCREENLFRKRKSVKRCPAAYKVSGQQRRIEE